MKYYDENIDSVRLWGVCYGSVFGFLWCGVVVCEMGGLNVFMKRKVLIFIIRVIWNCRVL